MSVAALITAGGRGTRIKELGAEKPMALLHGRPMIDHVLEQIMLVDEIGSVYVSVSDNVPRTREHLTQMGVRLLETSGDEYCQDLIQAAEGISEDHIFICPADLPLLRAELVADVVKEYLERKEQSLTVGIPLEKALEFGVDVTFYENVDGRPLMPCGVSVVDRLRMLTREYLPGSYYVADTPDVAINVNTVPDLEKAEQVLHQRLTCP
ncbi:MAG: Adenosylcobinamide-phosphate guanylyltransferase [Methanomassiliicoccales archaeon PtaB.Bin134]|nr:MAG: Adenosylcobinamide-phosphate guanylyltransferase [Methanomassiliicoccales archaeon PtaB.Bin134]